MKTSAHKREKEYAFHLLQNIFDFLSVGMVKIKSDCLFKWDKNRKELKAINRADGSSLEIHLGNISGLISNKPDFNMSIFPHKRRGGSKPVNLDRLKFVPPHCKPRWKAHKIPDGLFDEIIGCGRVGTLNNKPLESSTFR